ncbi:MAG: cupin domain-containing protein [Acidobacteriota bacterium]
MRMKVEEVIALLDLKPHPAEGGFFRETYRSALAFPESALSSGSRGPHRAGTAIYYLLSDSAFSALHRLPTDEVFHFYLGSPVEMLVLESGGGGRMVTLGTDLGAGMRPQVVVPPGHWQGSRGRPGGDWALLGTTMSPGFEFSDFEQGRREELVATHPAFRDEIESLTR